MTQTTPEAIKEMMEVYNDRRAKWIAFHGTDEGFNAWFTTQVKGN